ncbi:MAG: DUF438 domain-containing protein [Thermosipho sp. (in: Bacteria)]|nr:DUF438 domain-containing protein [Thermosipho sp. (in: thermotogales)]
MSELFNKKEYLKSLLKRLKNENNEEIKKEVKKLLSEISPLEIAIVEQELSKENGMTVDDVRNVCNIHIDVLKSKTVNKKLDVPEWHPIHILVKEHEFMQNEVTNFKSLVDQIYSKNNFSDAMLLILKIQNFTENFENFEFYFQKEENALFPILEKHGIEKPPMVMWKEHDIFRDLRKRLKNLRNKENHDNFEIFKNSIWKIATGMIELILNHIHKEHSILFPSALETITEKEWIEIRKEFDKIGYCCFTPKPLPKFNLNKEEKNVNINNDRDEINEDVTLDNIIELIKKFSKKQSDKIKLPSGEFTLQQLIAVLNALPVDITFVDEKDEVKYFNETKDRIFVRSRTIIGRKVQNCHPEKSIEIVNRILSDFKSGKRDKADFWLKMGEKYIYIQYFPVRNEKGEYLGTLEVTQDIAPIKKIEGEKRIYDD